MAALDRVEFMLMAFGLGAMVEIFACDDIETVGV